MVTEKSSLDAILFVVLGPCGRLISYGYDCMSVQD